MQIGTAKKIFFAVPTHSGEIKAQTTDSLIRAVVACRELGWQFEVHYRLADSVIPQARNVLVGTFVKSDCTDIVFVDADVAFDVEAFVKLIGAPVEFIAGAYRHKRDAESYPVQWLDRPELWADPETGLLEVKDVPMGFCRLTRRAVEKMCGAFADRTFVAPDTPDVQCWCLFDLEFSNGQYRGEDYVFCKRWRELGGQIWIDPMMKLSHVGSKTYSGSIGEWLLNRGKLEKLLEEAIGA